MQLPLYLKWSQARNKRSLFWFYLVLALVAISTLWSLPKLVSLLAFCLTLMLDTNNRHLLLEGVAIAALAIGATIALSRGTVVLWHLITTHLWQIPKHHATAIERLNDERIEHRLEGIHTLKRLAKLALRDQVAITKTLATFVQERAAVHPRGRTIAAHAHQTIAADIQAALTVIGRKPLVFRVMWRFVRKAYREGDRQINIGLTNLRKARLHYAHLQEANLYRSDLQQADLKNINLQKANLQAANLKACNLHRANLQEANLQNSNLQEATLYKTNLQQANLYNANLQGANLYWSNLQSASLQSANLQSANLYSANLQGAFLYGADLQAASLQAANLQEAFLSETNLEGTNLHKANLQGVTGLTDAQLTQAKLCMTVLPDGSVSNRDCAEFGLCDRTLLAKPTQEAPSPQPSHC